MMTAPRPGLSVVVPCYDQATTALGLLRRVVASLGWKDAMHVTARIVEYSAVGRVVRLS
jgi:hypothetical protein